MRDRSAPLLLLLGFVALTAMLYWPGLHGGFLFDDFANLPALGASGPVDSWPAFWRYITSGTADPTGRPVALLSFLVDAHDWPAKAFPFKRTNLLIHLGNGVLLALLLRQLGRLLVGACHPDHTEARRGLRVSLAAVLAAGLWMLHPLFVSTTLYIVQREAMLPATFVLLGLITWLHGRERLLAGKLASGVLWSLFGLGGCTLLAVLSKANGALLPLFALLIEYLLPYRAPLPATGRAATPASRPVVIHRAILTILGGLPAAALAIYLIHSGWVHVAAGRLSHRPWTLGQRLLTEPRVVMDYLRLLWLPRPYTSGLFNDQFAASTSLTAPLSTLPAIVAIGALLVLGWWSHRRLPALSVAILFYFAGQLLESTTIPLELYFEHRNYLPAMLMFWPLALWLCSVPQSHGSPGKSTFNHGIKVLLAVGIVAGLSTMTLARAELWGNTRDQARLWAQLNPASARAQASAAQAEMTHGRPDLAVARLKKALKQSPDEVQLAINLIGAECRQGYLEDSAIAASQRALARTANPGALLEHWFERVIADTKHPPCPQLTLDMLSRLLRSAASNPRLMAIDGRRQDLGYLRGKIALARGDGQAALGYFNGALDQDVREAAALKQAALLGANGFPRLGLAHLRHFGAVRRKGDRPRAGMARIHARVLAHQRYWHHEMQYLRRTLENDAKGIHRSSP